MTSPDTDSIAAARRACEPGRRIVCFSGAGLSAASGVGTFRDPKGGWWTRGSHHDPMRLASPEGFADDPDLVMDWYAARRIQMGQAVPNAAHVALANRPEITQVTQNTDDLLERAGGTGIWHLHGEINGDRCHAHCGHVEHVDLTHPPGHRPCPACGTASLRPTVVWFGEPLPADVWKQAEMAVRDCQTLLVVGTSAVVYPAAGLITLAADGGAAIVVVNTVPSAFDGIHHELIGSADAILPPLLMLDD